MCITYVHNLCDHFNTFDVSNEYHSDDYARLSVLLSLLSLSFVVTLVYFLTLFPLNLTIIPSVLNLLFIVICTQSREIL